jgi:hypothetical protein
MIGSGVSRHGVVGGNIDLGCDALNNLEGYQMNHDRLNVVEFGSR